MVVGCSDSLAGSGILNAGSILTAGHRARGHPEHGGNSHGLWRYHMKNVSRCPFFARTHHTHGEQWSDGRLTSKGR